MFGTYQEAIEILNQLKIHVRDDLTRDYREKTISLKALNSAIDAIEKAWSQEERIFAGCEQPNYDEINHDEI